MALLSHKRSTRLCAVALALAGVTAYRAATPVAIAAQSPAVDRQAVYAAFTLNLIRFISWPATSFPAPEAPLVVGSFPRDPINASLDAAVQGESADGHPLRTIRIQTLEDVGRCHLVFLGRGNALQAAVLQACAGKPILTVSDAEGFIELGGHVGFVPQAAHMRLNISATNLKSSRLEARSQLLRVAAKP